MKRRIDVHNFERRLERSIDRLDELDDVSPGNREIIRRFRAETFAQGYSPARILKYVSTLTSVAQMMDKDFDKARRKDMMELVTRIEGRDYSEWTKCTYKIILKVFYKWLKGVTEYPEEVAWIKSRPRNLTGKLPEELLTEKEVRAMVEAALHPRDKAFIAVISDGGIRIGEMLTARMKHVSYDEYGAVLTVTGKTGMRRVRLVYSAPHLATWMNLHPFKGDPEAPLWIEIRKTRDLGLQPMGYGAAKAVLSKFAKQAGIRKRIYPHLFRHSRATMLASHLTEAQMNHHFGWTQGSKMTATYVHMSGREVDSALIRLSGLKKAPGEEQKDGLRPRECPRCKSPNADSAKFCEKCWLPLDTETAMGHEKDLESRGQMISLFLQDPEVQSLFKRKMAGMLMNQAPALPMGHRPDEMQQRNTPW